MPIYDVEVIVRCRVETDGPATTAELTEDCRYLVDDALAFCFNEASFEHNTLPDAYTEVLEVLPSSVTTVEG